LDIFNVSIYQQLGEKVAGVVSTELDLRMKQAVTGDKDYQIGDLTKRAILNFTGKDEYTFGDITKSVGSLRKQPKDKQQPIVMDYQVEKELLEWDAAMATEISQGVGNDMDDDELKNRITRRQLEEWDTAFGAPKGDKSIP
jgi:uncharacterized protein YjbJ (UPF0337 family)